MGKAGYQSVTNRMLPLRGLSRDFDSWKSRLALQAVELLQPRLRAWARNRTLCLRSKRPAKAFDPGEFQEITIDSASGQDRDDIIKLLLLQRWKPAGDTDAWDLKKYDNRLLIATERGDNIAKRTLIRLWGQRSSIILPDDIA
jgi:hypothetical protein